MRMAGVWVLSNLCAAAVFFKCTEKRERERKRNDTKLCSHEFSLGACIFVVKTNENPRSGIALHCGTAGCVVLVTKMPHEGWQGTGVTSVFKSVCCFL